MPNMKTSGQSYLADKFNFVKAAVTFTVNPVTSKLKRVIYKLWLNSMPNMKTFGQRNLKFLGGQSF
jgi:hypothetical protein